MHKSATVLASYLALTVVTSTLAAAPDPAAVEFFEAKVRPVLADRCYKCHSAKAEKLKGGLLLDSREALLKGGDGGPAVVPGEPDKSKLIEAVKWSDPDLQMPPKQKLTPQQVADLAQWVKMGAPWPETAGGPAAKPPAGGPVVFDLEARKAAHWAWRPIRRPTLPAVKDAGWAKGAIDQFILAKLEEKGLTPAAPADRNTLLRRVTFDLTGLPPTPSEVEGFVSDTSPDAYEKVVDRLLASPHFGERWARHWMDLVRYAETRGHEFDPAIPNAWQYRDYLVRAFNADVPYDQFVTEHLAGDLLAQPRVDAKTGANESVLGTGFWLLGEEVHSPVDIRQDEADRMDNRVDTMAKAFLGLTVGCARCHDHKFDAIRQKDCYALTGFLLSSGYRQVPFESMAQNRRVAGQLEKVRAEARAKLLPAVVAGVRPTVDRFAEYLSAGREVLTAGKPSDADVTAAAGRHSLDPAVLRAVVDELKAAKGDATHPLHAFALVAQDAAADKADRLAAVLKPLAERATKPRDGDAAPAQVVVDYGAESMAGRWFADGPAFGLRPVRAGDLLLGDGPDRPVRGVATVGAAEQDLLFRPALAPGTETDHGALGGWQRAGQTLKTPTVTLKTGGLWYLVRGSGRAYAVVDSHLLIAGPLHGALLREWKGDPDKWQWVRHDLTAYPGQKCHVEFSPANVAGMAVAKVIESAQPQSAQPQKVDTTVVPADPPADSSDALAKAYQMALTAAADRLLVPHSAPQRAASVSESVRSLPDGRGSLTPSDLRLADWLVRNAARLSPGGMLPKDVADAARPFFAAQADLAKQIKQQSHTAPALLEGSGVDENVLVRGQAKNTGDLVPRRFLEAVAGANQKPYPADGSGRLQLAAAVLADDDPFPARVMVNRVWHHLFGRGIVPTVDNFGVLGQPPTHPELLDYLADTFRREQHWSVKRLIRSVVLSNAYQMSSRPSADAEQADPQDLLLHHMPVRRLEGEAIRDAILSVSGRIDLTVGGPSVEVHLTEFMDGRGRPGGGGPLDGAGRRSIYTKVRRNFLPPMMLAFDTPAPFACVGRRNVSNVPAQALILMNDPFVLGQAKAWAKRVLAGPGQTPEQRIVGMYLAALGRPAKPAEVTAAVAFLDRQGESYGLPPDRRRADERPWADLAHVMFNLKEFVFLR